MIPLSFAFAAVFWVAAIWVFRYRNRLEELNDKIPLIRRHRSAVAPPLFRTRGDVLWFAFWPFFLGSVFLFLAVVRLVS